MNFACVQPNDMRRWVVPARTDNRQSLLSSAGTGNGVLPPQWWEKPLVDVAGRG